MCRVWQCLAAVLVCTGTALGQGTSPGTLTQKVASSILYRSFEDELPFVQSLYDLSRRTFSTFMTFALDQVHRDMHTDELLEELSLLPSPDMRVECYLVLARLNDNFTIADANAMFNISRTASREKGASPSLLRKFEQNIPTSFAALFFSLKVCFKTKQNLYLTGTEGSADRSYSYKVFATSKRNSSSVWNVGLVGEKERYAIKNTKSGKYLCSTENSGKLIRKMKQTNQWKFEPTFPGYNVWIRNAATHTYLYISEDNRPGQIRKNKSRRTEWIAEKCEKRNSRGLPGE